MSEIVVVVVVIVNAHALRTPSRLTCIYFYQIARCGDWSVFLTRLLASLLGVVIECMRLSVLFVLVFQAPPTLCMPCRESLSLVPHCNYESW